MPENETTDAQPSKCFYLPSFEEATQVYEYRGSMRLPTYQFRHLHRYHPYIRYTRDSESDTTKYMNTIYDEERIELVIPPALRRRDPQAGNHSEAYSHVAHIESDRQQSEVERRIQRLSSVMAEFLTAIKRANELYEIRCLSSTERVAILDELNDTHRQLPSNDA